MGQSKNYESDEKDESYESEKIDQCCEKGPRGKKGSRGKKGKTGKRGHTGLPGPTGPTGPLINTGLSAVRTTVQTVTIPALQLAPIIFNNVVNLRSFQSNIGYNFLNGAATILESGIYLIAATILVDGQSDTSVGMGLFENPSTVPSFLRGTQILTLSGLAVNLNITTTVALPFGTEIGVALLTESGGTFNINGSTIGTGSYLSVQKLAPL